MSVWDLPLAVAAIVIVALFVDARRLRATRQRLMRGLYQAEDTP